MKVLVAEDDPVSLLILRRSVEHLGHECLTASDGARAWRTYRQTPDLDVIISDWMMPEMDGLELCLRVRSEPHPGGYTFFIFLTALSDREHLLEGMEAGADDYLPKPLDRQALRVRLLAAERVISLHHNLAEKNRQLETLNEKLSRQAREDPLTGLGNRLRMTEDLTSLHARYERHGAPYCLLLCDIDRFKAYNDRHGHLAGDDILRRVSQTLQSTFRATDTLYRYGGEEFLVMLPDQGSKDALTAAHRLAENIRALKIPHEDSPTSILTLSAGLACTNGGPATADELLKRTDDALYAAKEAGRDRVERYR